MSERSEFVQDGVFVVICSLLYICIYTRSGEEER